MISIKEVIVVEGKYDKISLSQVVDATIVTTDGFEIFKDKEKQKMLRTLAEKRGLIIFTDPDGAGLVIRGFLKGCVDNKYIKQAYIPNIPGKEKRKNTPSKEGVLGVEGMKPEVIIEALKNAGATVLESGEEVRRGEITKAKLYALGLSGGPGSAERRRLLQRKLSLPENLSANALLSVLNIITSAEELPKLIDSDL